MPPLRIAIVGGGPAGLVVLKTVLEASTAEQPIEACLFECESEIGGTFQYRSYENAELVSSKQLTTFSDHRFSLETPDHISLPEYVRYLQTYVDRFSLAGHIKLSTRVKNIAPLSPSASKWQHSVTYVTGSSSSAAEEIFECSHVAVCTGLHVTPAVPVIAGIENVKGPVLHSSEYKTRSQLRGHDILILGCGETAMDIAYESIKANARSVTMCFRTGFLSFPKVLNRFQVLGYPFQGRLPIDGLITNLFETAYVHHSIRASRLRSLISDTVIKKVMWFLTGTQEGCNQHVGALPNEILGRSYVFLNKSHKAMPYLNRPYKKPQWFLDTIGNKYLDPPEDANSPRQVDTCTWPTEIDATGQVHFTPRPDRKDYRRLRNTAIYPSCVIYCTGYRQDFSFLHHTYPTADQANVRNIVSSLRPDVAFIGFVRPGVGAIPPIAEQQAMWWTALITDRMALPSKPGHYKLLTRGPNARIDYGVDYSTYMSVLGKDFGGAPSLLELYREHDLKTVVAYCLGASFVSFYRLVGPFKNRECGDTARTELWDTIMRRGKVGNLFFGAIPMIFYGLVNLMAWLLEVIGVLGAERATEAVDT